MAGPTTSSSGVASPRSGGRKPRPRVPIDRRKRTSQACDICHRVKEKCDGGQPCGRCVKTRHECTYTTVAERKVARKAATKHSPERDLESPILDGEQAERMRYMERILTISLGDVPMDLQALKMLTETLSHQTKAPRRSHPTSEDGGEAMIERDTEPEDLEMEDEDFTVNVLSENSAQYSGEYSLWNLAQRIRRSITERLNGMVTEEPTNGIEMNVSQKLQSPLPSIILQACKDSLPPRRVTDYLVRCFFKYAQTNDFYVGEDWLHDKIDHYYGSPLIASDEVASLCIVMLILAIGTQFAHMDTEKESNRDGANLDAAITTADDTGKKFYEHACSLLAAVINTASLESVQACLLLGIYELPLDTPGLAYTYLGLALNLAIRNGMHRRALHGALSARTREVRNRVWWTVYTMEKRISILHGRPSTISHNEVDTSRPVDLPELRPRSGISNFENQSALIELTLLLEKIATEINLLRKEQRSTHFRNLFSLRSELIKFWDSLPRLAYCRDAETRTSLFRLHAHLDLHYWHTRLFLGRPFLLSTSKGRSPISESTSRARTVYAEGTELLRNDSIQAAFETITLCEQLRDQVGLARASYSTEFTSCRAAMLVLLAEGLRDRSPRIRQALARGMAVVKVMATGEGLARSEARVIEALEHAIRRLGESPGERSEEGVGNVDKILASDGKKRVASDYDHFKEWEKLWQTQEVSGENTLQGQHHNPTPVGELTTSLLPPTAGTEPSNDWEHSFSSFPMELNEFTLLPDFDLDFPAEMDYLDGIFPD